MGGTRVLRFCGRNNFELIISKRNPQLANNGKDESFSSWGFTLVRKEIQSKMFEVLLINN